MRYLITESQLKLISELERNWMDFEYEQQYNKLKDKLVPYIVNKIDSYNDEHGQIDLFNSDGETVMIFIPYDSGNGTNGSLYYNRDLDKKLERLFPHPIWMIHGKYIMSDVFNHFYPEYNVMSSQSSNIL